MKLCTVSNELGVILVEEVARTPRRPEEFFVSDGRFCREDIQR